MHLFKICDGLDNNQSDEQVTQQLMQINFNIKDMVTRFKLAQDDQRSDIDITEKIQDEIEILYPFAYKKIILRKKNMAHLSQPLVLQLLSSGSETILSHLFSSASDCNVQSQMYSNVPVNLGEDPDDFSPERLLSFDHSFNQHQVHKHTHQHFPGMGETVLVEWTNHHGLSE